MPNINEYFILEYAFDCKLFENNIFFDSAKSQFDDIENIKIKQLMIRNFEQIINYSKWWKIVTTQKYMQENKSSLVDIFKELEYNDDFVLKEGIICIICFDSNKINIKWYSDELKNILGSSAHLII
jgi:hypothetical protein